MESCISALATGGGLEEGRGPGQMVRGCRPCSVNVCETGCGLYSDVNKMLAQLLKSASIHQFLHPSVLLSTHP